MASLGFVWAGRLSPGVFAIWVVLTALFTWVVVRALRRRPRPAGTRLAAASLAVPWASLLITTWAFAVVGAHPLVQYNARDTMNGWSLWVGAWPILLAVSAFSAIGLLIALVATSARRGPEAAAPLAVGFLANVLAAAFVVGNFPSV